jgi:hypothetical protein
MSSEQGYIGQCLEYIYAITINQYHKEGTCFNDALESEKPRYSER